MANPKPVTIPALREWEGARGAFSLGPRPRIVVEPGHRADLRSEAVALADDLAHITRRRPTPANGGPLHTGDIQLRLVPGDDSLGREGYELTIGDSVRVRAGTGAGVFYGGRTLLQLLRQGSEVPAGRARDWPGYPERGLMLGNGDYLLPGFLDQQIRELAYLKLNHLHLHFADYRWQVESQRHPEVASDERVCLTREEVRRLVALARRHHITVVPEIDMPGHMGAALAAHPELQLEDAYGKRAPDKLDITIPAALRFARELIEDMLRLFPGPYWHAGGDEFMPNREYGRYPKLEAHARARYGAGATAADAFNGFINWVDGVVRDHGRTLRVWNDQLGDGRAVALSPDVIVEAWTATSPGGRGPNPPAPQQLLNEGHRVLNASWFPTYVVQPRPGRAVVDIGEGYETWHVSQFHGESSRPLATPQTISSNDLGILGSKLHVWWDTGPSEILPLLHPRLQLIAQKTWDSTPLVSGYEEFRQLGAKVGRAPANAGGRFAGWWPRAVAGAQRRWPRWSRLHGRRR